MDCDIQRYRTAIGQFNCIRIKQNGFLSKINKFYFDIFKVNLKCTVTVLALTLLQSTLPNIDIVFLLIVLHFILMFGNIENNPGPSYAENRSENHLSICNLNIRSLRQKLDFTITSLMNMIYWY